MPFVLHMLMFVGSSVQCFVDLQSHTEAYDTTDLGSTVVPRVEVQQEVAIMVARWGNLRN